MLRRVIGTFFGGALTRTLGAYLRDLRTRLSEGEVKELRGFLDGVETVAIERRRGGCEVKTRR